jgi:FtsZ-binding cell division protein ZapB
MELPTTCIVLFTVTVFPMLVSEEVSERGEEKRILLNDPDLINSQLEALRREVQALTNAQVTYQSKITFLENKILQTNHGRY